MEDGIQSRVCDVIADVLGVPRGDVSKSTSQQTVKGWDSLAHIHLIVALEAEFNVSFSIEQALELTSVPAIYAAVTDSVGRR
jgi:acyl carrier protein